MHTVITAGDINDLKILFKSKSVTENMNGCEGTQRQHLLKALLTVHWGWNWWGNGQVCKKRCPLGCLAMKSMWEYPDAPQQTLRKIYNSNNEYHLTIRIK